MQTEATFVAPLQAQMLFDSLPETLRVPSLSPAYVAADALRDPLVTAGFLVWQRGPALLLHGVHEARIPGRAESDWQSPYGYGGPLASGLDTQDLQDAWRSVYALARERRVVAEFVRFHPALVDQPGWYPGTVTSDRPVVFLDLAAADLLGSYSGRARTAVRKAINDGLVLRWEERSEAKASFPDFYRQGMREIKASPFYFFDDRYFDSLLLMPGARVLSVVRDGATLSMGVFLFGPRVAEYHLSAVSAKGRQSNATNLLLHGAAQAAQEAGLSTLYLGGGTAREPDNPLLRFKASFAPATSQFLTGSRIHDPAAYADLQTDLPDLAQSGRVLFYRR